MADVENATSIEGLVLEAYVLGFLASEAKPDWSSAASYRHCGAFAKRQMKDLRPMFDMLARAESQGAPSTSAEGELRKLLWMRHGCPITALYGDDGEMQCCSCVIDFKNDALEKLRTGMIIRPAATPEAETAHEGKDGVKRADKLVRGCIVMMKGSSGLPGWGNAQCVSSVCEPLGELSLFGHNQHYKIYDVAKVLEYPLVESDAALSASAQGVE